MTRPLALALATAVILGLTGCGGDDEDDPATPAAEQRTEAAPADRSHPADRPPTTGDRSSATTEQDGPGRTTAPEPPATERQGAAPAGALGLPPKQQREAAADSVCRAKGATAGKGLDRVCDALRRAARARTLAEYQRALRGVDSRPPG